jgi:hypothetical protein
VSQREQEEIEAERKTRSIAPGKDNNCCGDVIIFMVNKRRKLNIDIKMFGQELQRRLCFTCRQVMFTGTRSSLTWVHFTVPELEVVTWKTSAHKRQIGILAGRKYHMVI